MPRRAGPEGMRRLRLAAPYLPLLGRLEDACARARSAARRLGRPVLAWASAQVPAVDPVALFERAAEVAGTRILWARPADGRAIVGLGVAWEVAAAGEERFQVAAEAWWRCAADACGVGDARGPLALGGFAFAPHVAPQPAWTGFPPGLLVVPALAVQTGAAGTQAVLSALVMPDGDEMPQRTLERLAALLAVPDGLAPGADLAPKALVVSGQRPGASLVEEYPPAAVWKALVAGAAAAVRAGTLRKVVLARAVTVAGLVEDAAEVLRRLREGYPGCTLFAAARDGACFLGATPERLLHVCDGVVTTGALAGSAPRGATPAEDHRLGEALLASVKDRVEHAVVVEAMREALAAACTAVTAAEAPRLLRVSNVQHLHTPLEGRLRDPHGLLDLAGRLHPTPAVGGVPRAAALDWIARHEGFERGWYAGAVGWLDAAGDGEFSVAIRSALLRGRRATLFAGCGIVADSDPEAEYAESCLKLRPLAEALGAPAALAGCR